MVIQSETTEAFRFDIIVCCHSDLLMWSRGERSSVGYFLCKAEIMTHSFKTLCLFVFGATAHPPHPLPPVGHGLGIHEVSISHTSTHHRR